MNAQVLNSTVAATDNAVTTIRRALDKPGHGWATLLKLAGPAVVVSVAYIDPGNIATNLQAGAQYGYSLLWVAGVASLVATLLQTLSAKLGIVTGRNLAELSREHFPPPLTWVMWGVSELAAMATDLGEFLGGALGISLLFHMPLLPSMVVTAIVTYAVLLLEKRGFRPLELVVGALVGTIGLCYLMEILVTHVQWPDVAKGLVVYELPDTQAVHIAVGIIGATVMPHVLFLHSGLTQSRVPPRCDAERRRLLAYSNTEVIVALGIAGLINVAMIVMAAGAFHPNHAGIAEIQVAYQTLTPLLGAAAAKLFLVALIASGISSSVVGTMAGQMITQGFTRFQIPLWVRRAIVMVPSFVVVGIGVNATRALVASQVVLSLALPFPMIALVWFTGRRELMGSYRNGLAIRVMALLAVAMVLVLDALLVLQTFGIDLVS
ncbi:Nramp family divalent metal transporter [Dyella psychrodurans]|uniref:Divalent metal cation transporter MntH n=1 Tax=Dyella psychrodurans TaxID=1927960 RepID=A0A370XCR3_9GAMM|nr:Nramp family divalent metal transporter [Dyella psychrodurans]RDS86047.1 divalent metal cation transporter [Dyella psychrodurans]